jgi:hypothetical protein
MVVHLLAHSLVLFTLQLNQFQFELSLSVGYLRECYLNPDIAGVIEHFKA